MGAQFRIPRIWAYACLGVPALSALVQRLLMTQIAISAMLHIRLIPALACLALTACNDDGLGLTSPGASRRGVFLDSPVHNLSYGEDQRTDEDGGFDFSSSGTIEFRLGDIVIGSAKGAALITPVSLVPGAEDSEAPEFEDEVSNIARFLQTLDVDAEPGNGIGIPEDMHARAAGMSLDFQVTSANFEVDSEPIVTLLTRSAFGSRRELLSAGDAAAHLGSSLQSALVGTYRGTFDGDSEGRYEIFVDRSGQICGWAERSALGLVQSLLGQVHTSGALRMSAAVFGGMNYEGRITNGELSGTWSDPLAGQGGELIGDRFDAVDLFLDPASVRVGTYVGTSSLGDELVAVVDGLGNVEITNPYVCGAILSIDADGIATVVGVSINGDLIEGRIDTDGHFNGTFESFGGIGTFELVLP
ncbi:MAG: hypothetical protein ACI841_001694 [Planctomycetota bacterium]|jgi:hypothetical protein